MSKTEKEPELPEWILKHLIRLTPEEVEARREARENWKPTTIRGY